MLHALTSEAGSRTFAWIPVREEQSPQIPFDFGSENVLSVPREEGEFNEDDFRAKLRARLRALS